MDNPQGGVNENGGVQAPAVNSPITQTQAQIVESAGEPKGSESAETLKTENRIPESVPYQRFKEVNDKAKAAEDLLLEIYQAINSSEEPAAKKIEPAKPESATPQDPIAQLAQEVAQLKAEKTKEKEVSAVDSYDRAYEEKAAKEVPQELRDVFDEMVARRVLAYNKGIPTSFDPKILNKAYDETKKIFEPAMKRLTPTAAAQNVPPTAAGDPPIKPTQAPRTFEERRAFIQKAFESGKRLF